MEVVNIYEKISALLEEAHKSAYQLSKETGVSQTALSNCRNGISNLSLRSIAKIAAYFDKPIEYFLN